MNTVELFLLTSYFDGGKLEILVIHYLKFIVIT